MTHSSITGRIHTAWMTMMKMRISFSRKQIQAFWLKRQPIWMKWRSRKEMVQTFNALSAFHCLLSQNIIFYFDTVAMPAIQKVDNTVVSSSRRTSSSSNNSSKRSNHSPANNSVFQAAPTAKSSSFAKGGWKQRQVQIKTLEGEFNVTMWAPSKYLFDLLSGTVILTDVFFY